MTADGHWRRVLVLGGARSGKSTFAEQLASECGEPVVYVAAATVEDPEMEERVRRHREQRPPTWRTVEARSDVADVVASTRDTRTVLVEDLTLLLSDRFRACGDGDEWESAGCRDAAETAEQAVAAQVEQLFGLAAHVVLVSNEVGMGVVPPTPLGRLFRDALGRVNQVAAARADEVYLLVAGLPLTLKPRDAGALAWSPFP